MDISCFLDLLFQAAYKFKKTTSYLHLVCVSMVLFLQIKPNIFKLLVLYDLCYSVLLI